MDPLRFNDPDAVRIADFLESIGIELVLERLDGTTFLEGVAVRNGRLVADPERLPWPGDLLHEAGHIAVADPAERPKLNALPEGEAGDEMAAIAWSWAAARAIGIAPEILFHEGGYRGGSKALIENFGSGRYVGVPMLHYYGLTVEPRQAEPGGPPPYPQMIRWLR